MPKSVDTNKNDDYGDNMVEITNYQNRKEITYEVFSYIQ
jgi:hypothetical protein